jgi:iron complex outermembrane receptor protein
MFTVRWFRLPIIGFGCLSMGLLADDAMQLPELLITGAPTATAEELANTSSLADTLRSLPGLHLSPQGIGGQSDLSIQGSSFSGAGLSLQGLALRNPQTEHFHSELPVLPEVFGTATVRTGIEQQALTSTYLAGSVDLGLGPIVSRGRLSLGVGEFSARGSTLYAARAMASGQGTLGVAAFGAVSAANGDPLRGNDLRRNLGGLHLQYRQADWQLDALAARGSKTFGAQGYYGAPASLPSEETLRDSLLFLSARKGDLAGEYVRFAAAWRELRDTYLLDASRPLLYTNKHHSRLFTVAMDQRLQLDASWSLLYRLEAEREDLDSTYEGTISAAPLGKHWRARTSFFVMPEYTVGDWRFSAGLRGTGFTDDRPAWLPAAGIVWTPNANTEVSLAYSETVRLPSYTELNYDSPSSLGNAGLERQQARSLELAATTALTERVRVRALGFVRRETDSVDWLKTSAGSGWLATNLDSVDVWGARLGLDLDVLENLLVQVGGEVLRKRTANEPYSSRYALDYPEATAQVAAVWQALSWCQVRAEQSVSRMTDNPERGADRTSWLGSLNIVLRPPQWDGLSVTLGVANVWDECSEPVVGVEAPGRQARVSVAYEW